VRRGDSPIDLGKEWTDRLGRVEALAVSKKVSAEDRSHLATFPEIVVLTHLILAPHNRPRRQRALSGDDRRDEPTIRAGLHHPRNPEPLYRKFFLCRDRDFHESQVV
jgi:hypothetical protein